MPHNLFSSIIFAVFLCLVSENAYASSNIQRNQLKVIEVKHPRCESQTLVETAKETFTTIANDLPGRNEYNELVKTFHRGQWEKLDRGFEDFVSLFEDSPLKEAVAFLRVESLYDRIQEVDSPIVPEAEKTLRETLLLYPKSKLVPNIQATVGAFWLRNGLYSKSLALFLKAKAENPFHPLSCFFQFGIGESNFLLHEKEAARKNFTALLQKCDNPRLNTGATLRIIEMDQEKNSSNDFVKKLDSLYSKDSNIVSRFYPEALYNLGEGKYQKGEYRSARFFFSEYLDNKKKDPQCAPYAMKRMADISLKLKAPIEETSALYLQTSEQFPKSDIGKFAYIQAMLMDYPQKNRSEQERRTVVIDEKMAAVQDPSLRYVAAVSKGLTLLEAGEVGALKYLAKTTQLKPEDIKNKEVAEFISERLIAILRKQADENLQSETKNESVKDEELFNPIEEIFAAWIKGTREEKEANALYGEMVAKRFEELSSKEKWSYAFDMLNLWKQSSLWAPSDPPESFKNKLGMTVTSVLMGEEGEKKEALCKAIQENEATLSRFLPQDFYPVFIASYLTLKDKEGVARWIKKMSPSRKYASTKKNLTPEMKDFLCLKNGEGLFENNRFKEADEILRSVRATKYLEASLNLRIRSLESLKQYKQAYRLGTSWVSKMPTKDAKVRTLASLVSVINEGKMWEKAEVLLTEARKQRVEGPALAPFLYLSGKVNSERKNCKRCISLFTEAMSLVPDYPMLNEAKFRTAKCLLKEKKKDLAKKQWQEVADSKDSFWGPLAKSELNLMEEP